MKIKVKATKEQKKEIEDQLIRWRNGIKEAKRRCEEEIKKREKQINDWKEFWSNNEMPIWDWRVRSRNTTTGDLYETKQVWKKFGQVNTVTLKEMEGWVCKYCGQETITKHIATGYDHTDYSYDTCDCADAKKRGKPYCELV